MKRVAIKNLTVGALVAVAAIIFAATANHALFYNPEPEAPPPAGIAGKIPPQGSAAASPYPSRLIIPALSIDAPVQRVGISYSGNMMPPSNYTDVGWYKYGTLPGASGSAVMDGHVDNGFGFAAVFKHLGDIKTGADIYVAREDGTKLHFVVSRTESYPYTSVPRQAVFAESGGAYLNLITCEGSWVPGSNTYDHRLVIFSTLAS